MNIVIQCASSKAASAGCMKESNGKSVFFVADPGQAPAAQGRVYAHPDDPVGSGKSWRDSLLEYNRQPGDNPLGLRPAWQLYNRDIYTHLVDAFGVDNVYILSAGWGLVRASFLTPYYDITFSAARNVEPYKRRRKRDIFLDCCQLPMESTDPLVFFGGKDYLPLFCHLTQDYTGPCYVFYNSTVAPSVPGSTLARYKTSAKTNWHYICATDFIRGNVALPQSE